jgi:hypothetical protein
LLLPPDFFDLNETLREAPEKKKKERKEKKKKFFSPFQFFFFFSGFEVFQNGERIPALNKEHRRVSSKLNHVSESIHTVCAADRIKETAKKSVLFLSDVEEKGL